MTLYLPLLWLGCSEPAPTPSLEAPAVDATRYGWVGEVALHPRAFGTGIEAERQGWTALHAHDYRTAAASFDTPAHRARPEMALGLLHEDLALVASDAATRLFEAWADQGGLPEEGASRTVAALAAWCAGTEEATAWARMVPADAPGAVVARAIAEGRDPGDAVDADDPFVRRLALHEAARRGEVEALEAALGLPILEEDAEGFVRTHHDPCGHHALAAGWQARAVRSLDGSSWRAMRAWGDGGLSGRLFSPWLDAAGLLAEVESAEAPGRVGARHGPFAPLGLADLPSDDPEVARELVHTLDEQLAAWRSTLADHADADGDALLGGLGLLERYRQEWLVVVARDALHQGHPRTALELLRLAHDASESGIGPANSPSLFALTAAAELRSGRARQALDALEPLSDSFTSVRGVQELVGDLAVLEGLTRQGDSKESP